MTTNQRYIRYSTIDSHGMRCIYAGMWISLLTRRGLAPKTVIQLKTTTTCASDWERWSLRRGFLGKCFSWKKCLGIEFAMVSTFTTNSLWSIWSIGYTDCSRVNYSPIQHLVFGNRVDTIRCTLTTATNTYIVSIALNQNMVSISPHCLAFAAALLALCFNRPFLRLYVWARPGSLQVVIKKCCWTGRYLKYL